MSSSIESSLFYYEREGSHEGPVSRDRLVEMVESGEIDGETLVWAEGMPDWKPFSEAQEMGDPSDPMVKCAYSGEVRPESQMLPFGDGWVAPEFKDQFVQQLAEGGVAVEDGVMGEAYVADFTLGTMFSQSWKIWTDQLFQILLITLIVWGPISIAMEFLVYEVFTEDPESLEAVQRSFQLERAAEFWIGVIATGGTMMIAILRWNGGGKVDLPGAFSEGFRNYGRLLGTRFLLNLLVMGGAIVLCVPIIVLADVVSEGLWLFFIPLGILAIWLIVRLGCADGAALIREEGGMPAIKYSWKMTKGRVWKICLFRIAAYSLPLVVVFITGMVLAIPQLDNFWMSGIVSAIGTAVLSFTIVFEAIMALQLRAVYEG